MEGDTGMESVELWKLSSLQLDSEWGSGLFEKVAFTFENSLETLKRTKDSLKLFQDFPFYDNSRLSFSVYHLLNHFIEEESILIFDDFDTFAADELKLARSRGNHDEIIDYQHKNVLINLLKPDRTFELQADQVSLFFLVCCHLKVRQPIRFRALEIYERFLKLCSKEIANSNVRQEGKVESRNTIKWSQFIIGGIQLRLFLWMSVCILLADKLENQQSLKAKDIKMLFTRLSTKVTSKLICQAEFAIIKALDGYISWKMPHELMENLLVYCELSPRQHQRVYLCGLLILKMAYFQNDKLRVQYFLNKNNEITQPTQNTYSYGIWLTAGVVATAIQMVLGHGPVTKNKKKTEKTEITEITEMAISRVSSYTDVGIDVVTDLVNFIKEEYME